MNRSLVAVAGVVVCSGCFSSEEPAPLVPEGEPYQYVISRIQIPEAHSIARAIQGRVFEPFFTTKEHGKGTGLGLATVLGIVTQSGGDIRLDSEADAGTTVLIRLPSVTGMAEADAPPVAPRPAQGGETVLVAEDNPDVRRVLDRILRGSGYQVLLAADGAEALTLAADGRAINLLVTDVVMPGMDGPALARALRERRPDIGVLFTSGFSDVPATQLEDLTPAPLLPKPYTANEVATAVRAALDAARVR